MEQNLNESMLLSTMSPKADKSAKTCSSNKKVRKLALKKQVRRSTIYDKLPHANANIVVISGSDTTESISSTCSLKSEDSYANKKTNKMHGDQGIKFDEIEKWINEINKQNNFNNEIPEEQCNDSVFSEISAIYPNNQFRTDEADLPVNSTFVHEKNCFRFDEMFLVKPVKLNSKNREINEKTDNKMVIASKECKKTLDINTENRYTNNDGPIIINDSFEENPDFETPIKTQKELNEHEKLLDDLYGKSWRANMKQILTPFDQKQNKKIKEKQFPNTEKKPKQSVTHKNPYLPSEISKSKSLIRSLHINRVQKVTESPWFDKFKDLCDSGLRNTKMKPKQSVTHKNPYLPSEISKSKSLIRSLHINRVQKVTESPWFDKFKDLCDSESSIEDLNTKHRTICKTKLNFDESDNENVDNISEFSDNVECKRFVNVTPRKPIKKNDDKENFHNFVNPEEICEDLSDNSDFSFEIVSLEDRLKEQRLSDKQNNKSAKNEIRENGAIKGKNDIRNVCNTNEGNKNKKSTKQSTNKTDAKSLNTILTSNSDTLQNNKEDKTNEKPLIKSKYFSDDSPSPETKLRNILATLSKDKVNKVTPSKKLADKNVPNTKQQKSDTKIRSIRSISDDSSDDDYVPDETRHSLFKNKKCKNGPLSFLESLSGSIPIDKCNASARIYRNSYKTTKIELAKKLFDLYNEKVFDKRIPSDTSLEWNDRMRKTAGFCYCKKITRRTGIVERTARIVLATKILASADRLRDTLIHEMCHAATWIVNEISDGHGRFWKAWATKAMNTFPELPPIKRCHDYSIETKYTYKCTNCGYSIGRHSKSLNIERKRCGYCYGKFEVYLNKKTKNGLQSIATPKKEPTGFALFVKENYGDVKKTSNANHGDTMKALGRMFGELKTK